MLKLYAFTAGLLISFVTHAADIEADQITLRGVDKITGRISTMQLAVGESIEFGKLHISVNKCLTKPIEEAPENAAFLTIVKRKNNDVQPVFNGWMFSSNPALSAMEDPVYDVWVIDCDKTNDGLEPVQQMVKPVIAENQIVVMENLEETIPETNAEPNLIPHMQEIETSAEIAPETQALIDIETLPAI